MKSNEAKHIKVKTIKGKAKSRMLPTAAQLADKMDLLQRVYDARKDGMSFSELEKHFGLRDANGMTSYRMVKRYQAMSKSRR